MNRPEHRRDERYDVAMGVTLTARKLLFRGKTVNLSLGGFRVRLDSGEMPRALLEVHASLVFPTGGRTEGTAKVVWVTGSDVGLSFSGPLNPRVLAFTQLEARRTGR